MPRLALTPATHPTRAALWHRLPETARQVFTDLERERRLRATIRDLRALNDRTLKDIGLQREDIAAAVRDRCRHE